MVAFLGDIFPNFEANTTVGPIKFHDWLGERYVHIFLLKLTFKLLF